MTVPRRITRPDVVLHGEEAGVGPTVLLLHAGGERGRVWTPVMDVLVAAGFRCVAYDQRDSDTFAPYADDVAAMLDAEPPGCVVVGASLGGLAAIAALRPGVAGLVLVDVVPDLDPDRVRRFLAANGVLDGHTAIVDDTLAQVPRFRRIVAESDVPLLLVRGGNGSAITDDDVDRLPRIAPHATVTCVPEAGHLVARDQPVALAEAIASVATEWPALALLRELGADHVDHPGGNLLDHLRRVRDLVAGWGGSRRVRLAALCHATYGTDGFPRPLLPLDQRARLCTAIGDDAEALVYLYAACDRKRTYADLGATLTDRFTGEVVALEGNDLTDFALLTVANELDVARNAVLTPEARGGIRALITALAPYAPEATGVAVSDSSLL
jgi:pimeloyl-ACP methyl ester carboxylesterase